MATPMLHLRVDLVSSSRSYNQNETRETMRSMRPLLIS